MKRLANIKALQLLKSELCTPLWEPLTRQVKPPGYALQVVMEGSLHSEPGTGQEFTPHSPNPSV